MLLHHNLLIIIIISSFILSHQTKVIRRKGAIIRIRLLDLVCLILGLFRAWFRLQIIFRFRARFGLIFSGSGRGWALTSRFVYSSGLYCEK